MTVVNYTLSEDEYVRAVLAHCRARLARTAVVLAVLIAVAILFEDFRYAAIGGLVGGLAVMAVQLLWWVPRQTRAIFREQRSASEPRELTLLDDYVEFSAPSGNYKPQWTDILKWSEASGMMRLYISRAQFIPLPMAQLGAVAEEIRTRLIGSGLTKPGKRRKK